MFQDKPRALERLRWMRIRALNLWWMPHVAADGAFPRAMELRRTVVGLPVHQELRPGDVERVAEAASLLA